MDETWIRDYWRDFNLCKIPTANSEKDGQERWPLQALSLSSLKGCGY